MLYIYPSTQQLNKILENLLHHNLVEQADSIITNTELDEPYRSTNQAARFCFFKGYVKAVQLDYTEANHLLHQALRKAPEKAVGFRTIATKLGLIVQLLMGEIPPRSEFLAKVTHASAQHKHHNAQLIHHQQPPPHHRV